ncbi:MAG: MFS transporter [Gammaproteobacteria bacterium]|nr:MFS transporter [Gammaproteobacteria bacterium]MCP5139471.1 MFS transporter [Chromatiales bacterium]
MSQPPPPASAGRFRLGPIEFAQGITGLNASTYLYVSFIVMPIVSFLSFTQPYVLNEIVGIPLEEQGRLTGFLSTMQEIIALCLIGFVSGLSDRFGRRPIYATGAFIAGIGFGLYGFATSEQDLYLYRFVYAIGVTAVGAMIAVTAADYPAETSRGKLSGATGLLNGLGVGLAILLGSKIPAVLKDNGFDGADAGRYMLLTVAAICVVTAIIMQLGLKGGTPTGKRSKVGLIRTLQIGLREGRLNPRLIICYAGSGVGRADLTLVVTFVSLWLQQLGRDEGMSGAEALKSAGIMLAIIQGSSLLSAPFIGISIDRFHRLTSVMVALLVAGLGYTLLGMQTQPFTPLGYMACALVGIGQMGVILTVTALLGQETPIDVRGSVIGFAGLCGAAGILITSLAGGYLFDHWMISGPIILTGVANLLIGIGAFVVWNRDGRPVRFDPGEAKSLEPAGFGH